MADIEHGRDLDRVSAFSDGVFAIAITVLVLSIDIPPDLPNDELPDLVGRLVRPVLTYFLSFYVVGFYWFAHHRMWHFLRRVDGRFLALNMVLLSFVALMPFPTDLMGDYGDTSEATAVYAAAAALTGAASTLLWWYASKDGRLVKSDTPLDYRNRVMARGALVPIVFGVSVPLAFLNAELAKAFWLVLIPARLLLTRGYGNVYDM
jgi:uncharacterized membrane protein